MALRAAKELKEQHNVDAEVIDLRSIRPLDEAAILKSVKKTNRALLIDETSRSAGSAPRFRI
jgi:pyruvate dehydrogenase E1 component beta subunit